MKNQPGCGSGIGISTEAMPFISTTLDAREAAGNDRDWRAVA
jgi:hypothetical protein